MLHLVGIKNFISYFTEHKHENRGFIYKVTDEAYLCNPYEEFMERAEEFINYLMNSDNNKFIKLRKVITPTIVKLSVSRTITNIIEVEADSHLDAIDYVSQHIKEFDPLTIYNEKKITLNPCTIEILPN